MLFCKILFIEVVLILVCREASPEWTNSHKTVFFLLFVINYLRFDEFILQIKVQEHDRDLITWKLHCLCKIIKTSNVGGYSITYPVTFSWFNHTRCTISIICLRKEIERRIFLYLLYLPNQLPPSNKPYIW